MHFTAECERNDLQRKVKTLQIEEEARRDLEERTQLLESQVSDMQLLLDKEIAKYQSACRQQEVSIKAYSFRLVVVFS